MNDLVYQDVLDFFSVDRTESDQLELKSSFGQLNQDSYNGVIRSITAFLNSKGGLLIWGAPVGVAPQGRREKIFQGALSPIPQVLTKDALISKCSDSITPLPNSIRVKVIENGAGACVCIFEVDESEYSPHQLNGLYPMRIDGQTKPAPHHYVEALFKRIRYPNVEGFLKIIAIQRLAENYKVWFEIHFFNWSPLQNGEKLSFRVICEHGEFDAVSIRTNPNWYGLHGHEYIRRPVVEVIHYGEPIVDRNYVLVPHHIISQHNNRLTFTLTFGCLNTPAKSGDYVLDVSNINARPADSAVISRQENRLYKDVLDSLGTTRESVLESVLERRPTM